MLWNCLPNTENTSLACFRVCKPTNLNVKTAIQLLVREKMVKFTPHTENDKF